MAYKLIERGAPPAVILRKLRCPDCQNVFEQRCATRGEPVPHCPVCAVATSQVPSMPAVRASPEKRAAVEGVDLAWKMAQEDYGLTNMNDHVKPGDMVAQGPAPMHTAEREAATREMIELAHGNTAIAEALTPDQQLKVKDFWQGGMGGGNTAPEQMGAARAASQDAVEAKVDALSVLEQGKSSGTMAPRYSILNSQETRKLEI